MFTKKTGPEPKPVASPRSTTDSTFSMLGPDIAIKGDISASADLHIDGKVEGDIACASLVQGETSEIVGGITAESARLAGKVQGSITARELVILKSAKIRGDVQYDTLTIEQGAVVDGHLSPNGSSSASRGSPQQSDEMLILTKSAE